MPCLRILVFDPVSFLQAGRACRSRVGLDRRVFGNVLPGNGNDISWGYVDLSRTLGGDEALGGYHQTGTLNVLTRLRRRDSRMQESRSVIRERARFVHLPGSGELTGFERTLEISSLRAATVEGEDEKRSKVACVRVKEVVWIVPKLIMRIRPARVDGEDIFSGEVGCDLAWAMDHWRKSL